MSFRVLYNTQNKEKEKHIQKIDIFYKCPQAHNNPVMFVMR